MTRRSISVPIGIMAALLLAANASAAPPTGPRLNRSVPERSRAGRCRFQNHNVAIIWDEPNNPRRLGIATSNNSGASFSLEPFIFGARASRQSTSWQPTIVTELLLAHRHEPGNWVIEYTDFFSFDAILTYSRRAI